MKIRQFTKPRKFGPGILLQNRTFITPRSGTARAHIMTKHTQPPLPRKQTVNPELYKDGEAICRLYVQKHTTKDFQELIQLVKVLADTEAAKREVGQSMQKWIDESASTLGTLRVNEFKHLLSRIDVDFACLRETGFDFGCTQAREAEFVVKPTSGKTNLLVGVVHNESSSGHEDNNVCTYEVAWQWKTVDSHHKQAPWNVIFYEDSHLESKWDKSEFMRFHSALDTKLDPHETQQFWAKIFEAALQRRDVVDLSRMPL